jgi:hypothetical protein
MALSSRQSLVVGVKMTIGCPNGLSMSASGETGNRGGRCCWRKRELGDRVADRLAPGVDDVALIGSVRLRRGYIGELPALPGDTERRLLGDTLAFDRVGEAVREEACSR